MSKPSRRPSREARKEHKRKRRKAQQALRKAQAAAGLKPVSKASAVNRLCPYKTPAEEQADREAAVGGQLGVLRRLLPTLLKQLRKIADIRQPKKVKHKLTVVLLYGLLSFVLPMSSRRQANRELSRPAFLHTLQELFPELESLPHADTLHRVLSTLEVEHLEQTHMEVVRYLIRSKKCRRYLLSGRYPIAIDGTQKLVRDGQWWDEEWLERRGRTAEGEWVQQYVYVLEANIVLPNGVTLPLLSEFLSYSEGDPDDHKQDCELNAFYRLAKRLKGYFPRLPILVLLDGLYPKGPLMRQCDEYGWSFMIVLPKKCLPSVWEEIEGLSRYQGHQQKSQHWRGRRQRFWWRNDIHYSYDRDRQHLTVHVLGCDETWTEIDPDSAEPITQQSTHVWLSSQRLCRDNVHERGNLGGRRRWGIELSFQIEKHQGYYYEHAFSYTWNAMRGYHYLMRLAHLLNALALATRGMCARVREHGGVQAFLHFVRDSCAHPWLRPAWCHQFVAYPPQLRLE